MHETLPSSEVPATFFINLDTRRASNATRMVVLLLDAFCLCYDCNLKAAQHSSSILSAVDVVCVVRVKGTAYSRGSLH